MSLVAVHLHGPLADKFGALHHFDISNAREAVNALDANYRGFRREFLSIESYKIFADGEWRDGDHEALLPVSRELHLCPVIEGRVFAIAPLISTALGVSTATATIIGGVILAGVLLGVSLLLAKKQKKKEEEHKKEENFAFGNIDNVTAQGAAVPLVYGRCFVGSVVISAGLKLAEEFIGGTGGTPTGGGGGGTPPTGGGIVIPGSPVIPGVPEPGGNPVPTEWPPIVVYTDFGAGPVFGPQGWTYMGRDNVWNMETQSFIYNDIFAGPAGTIYDGYEWHTNSGFIYARAT